MGAYFRIMASMFCAGERDRVHQGRGSTNRQVNLPVTLHPRPTGKEGMERIASTDDFAGRLAVLERLVAEAARHVAHAIERVAAPEQVLHVLGHDPRHVLQVLVQPLQPVRRSVRSGLVPVRETGRFGPSRVEVESLGALDEGVEFDKRVRSQAGFEGGLGRVGAGEFGAEFREVGEGEFARVRLVGDDEVDDRVRDQVAARTTRVSVSKGVQSKWTAVKDTQLEGALAALDGAARFRLGRQPPKDELCLLLVLGQLGDLLQGDASWNVRQRRCGPTLLYALPPSLGRQGEWTDLLIVVVTRS